MTSSESGGGAAAPRPAAPPIIDAHRAAARRSPGQFVYAIDPAFDPAGPVPPEAVVGAWKVADDGTIVEEFEHNPRYRPTARALGLAPPQNPLEEIMQAVSTGWGSEASLFDVLFQAELFVFSGPGGELMSSTADDGSPVVVAFTSRRTADASGWEEWKTISGKALATSFPPEHDLVLDPIGPVRVRLSGVRLSAAVRRRGGRTLLGAPQSAEKAWPAAELLEDR